MFILKLEGFLWVLKMLQWVQLRDKWRKTSLFWFFIIMSAYWGCPSYRVLNVIILLISSCIHVASGGLPCLQPQQPRIGWSSSSMYQVCFVWTWQAGYLATLTWTVQYKVLQSLLQWPRVFSPTPQPPSPKREEPMTESLAFLVLNSCWVYSPCQHGCR